MNKKLTQAIFENLQGYGESECAEIFNIYANSPDRLSWGYEQGEYIFNIMDNRQAAKAVAMFGFQTVANASLEDWIIRAKKNGDGKWEFSSVAPSLQIEGQIEEVLLDIVSRPRDYPAWVWGAIKNHLVNYLMFGESYNP